MKTSWLPEGLGSRGRARQQELFFPPDLAPGRLALALSRAGCRVSGHSLLLLWSCLTVLLQGKVVFPDNKMFKTLADAWDLPKFKFMIFVIDGK
jgi:hypothetical protein